jgi:hypothetical protein
MIVDALLKQTYTIDDSIYHRHQVVLKVLLDTYLVFWKPLVHDKHSISTELQSRSLKLPVILYHHYHCHHSLVIENHDDHDKNRRKMRLQSKSKHKHQPMQCQHTTMEIPTSHFVVLLNQSHMLNLTQKKKNDKPKLIDHWKQIHLELSIMFSMYH